MKLSNVNKFIIAFLLAGMTTSSVWANSGAWAEQLSLETGLAFPTSANNYSDSENVGFLFGARYLHRITPNFDWGLQTDYYHFGAKDNVITGQYGGKLNSRSTDNVATLEMVGRYSFFTEAKYVPYVHSGVGITYFHQSTEGEPTGGSGWFDTQTKETRQLQDTGSLGFSYSVGLGVEAELTQTLVLGLETAWHIFGVSETSFGTSTINVPTISVRLGWRFGQFAPSIFTTNPTNS
jgi:opacity protein-like surface antigen